MLTLLIGPGGFRKDKGHGCGSPGLGPVAGNALRLDMLLSYTAAHMCLYSKDRNKCGV